MWTLRVSGLFSRRLSKSGRNCSRPALRRWSAMGEPDDNNPYATLAPRVFGPRPGLYGLAMGAALEDYSAEGRATLGEAWLTGSEWAIDAQGNSRQDRAALETRVLAADGFAHMQDLAESDLLLASDYCDA